MTRRSKKENSRPDSGGEIPDFEGQVEVGPFDFNRRSHLSPQRMADYLRSLCDGVFRFRAGSSREPMPCCYCFTLFDDPNDDEGPTEHKPFHKIVNDGQESIEMQLFDALLRLRDVLTKTMHRVAQRHSDVMHAQLPSQDGGWPMLRAGVFKNGKLVRTVLFADPREEFCRAINDQGSGQTALRLQGGLKSET